MTNFSKIFQCFSFLNLKNDGFEQLLAPIRIAAQLLLYFFKVLSGQIVDILECRIIVHRILICYCLQLQIVTVALLSNKSYITHFGYGEYVGYKIWIIVFYTANNYFITDQQHMAEYAGIGQAIYEQQLLYEIMPFNNPICKETYQSLPRIYGNKKPNYNKKYLHIQSKLLSRDCFNIPKYSLTPDNVKRINKYLYPHYQRFNQALEYSSSHRRILTEAPGQSMLSNSQRKLQLKPITSEVKSFHISDLETAHKVHPITSDTNEPGRPASQLQKLQQLNKKQIGRSKTQTDSSTIAQSKSINSRRKLKAVPLNDPPHSRTPNDKIFNGFEKQFHQIEQENEQENSDKINNLNERKNKNSTSETNSQSQKSAISLSRHVFSEKSDPTMFRNIDNKYSNSKLGNSRHSKTASVLDNGLFRIPQQKQYRQYICKYKPMSQKFNLLDLVRKQNFKIVRDQKSVYFGQVNDEDQRHGFGIFISDKEIFEGQFADNLRVVGFQRNIDGTYIGGYQNGVRTGEGVFRWNNGQVFKGNWQKGMKNGFGVWKSPQGHFYQGQWAQNRQNGTGMFKHSLSTYRGQFVNFLKNGKGQQVFVNGDKYKGNYKDGKPDGKGKYQWSQGGYYQGDFKQGKREGYGIWVDSEGTKYQGQFLQDSKHGKGIQVYKTGERYEGLFKDGFKVNGKLFNSKNQQIEIIVK